MTRDASGFSWIDADDRGGNVFSWIRYDGDGQMIACITNFSSEPRPDHQIGLPTEGVWKEILNTDAEVYDGTGLIGNLGQVVAHPVPSHGYVASASVTIPPLGAVWLRLEPELDEEQAIEPEKATRAVRAAAKVASPHATTGGRGVDGAAGASARQACGDGPGQRRPPPGRRQVPNRLNRQAIAERQISIPESPSSPDSPASPATPEPPPEQPGAEKPPE